MTPGQLVSAVSIALDVPHETVVVHDRNLSVAGLRTKGARGRNAPAVTPLDAARLVTAILGSARVVDSVETVRAFQQVTFSETIFTGNQQLAGEKKEYDSEKSSLFAVMDVPEKHNFTEGLAGLIRGASSPIQTEYPELLLRQFAGLDIRCSIPGTSFIGALAYERMKSEAEVKKFIASWKDIIDTPGGEEYFKNSYRLYAGIRQTRRVHSTAIVLLGRAFRENGLPFKTTREAIADLIKAGAGKRRKPPRAK